MAFQLLALDALIFYFFYFFLGGVMDLARETCRFVPFMHPGLQTDWLVVVVIDGDVQNIYINIHGTRPRGFGRNSTILVFKNI